MIPWTAIESSRSKIELLKPKLHRHKNSKTACLNYKNLFVEEKSAEDVKDMLTMYRDKHPDHLPAHENLLDFLHQEYSDEPDVLVPHLKHCVEKFPGSLDHALRYSEVLKNYSNPIKLYSFNFRRC